MRKDMSSEPNTRFFIILEFSQENSDKKKEKSEFVVGWWENNLRFESKGDGINLPGSWKNVSLLIKSYSNTSSFHIILHMH